MKSSLKCWKKTVFLKQTLFYSSTKACICSSILIYEMPQLFNRLFCTRPRILAPGRFISGTGFPASSNAAFPKLVMNTQCFPNHVAPSAAGTHVFWHETV